MNNTLKDKQLYDSNISNQSTCENLDEDASLKIFSTSIKTKIANGREQAKLRIFKRENIQTIAFDNKISRTSTE